MDAGRAKKIATTFTGNMHFRVRSHANGLLVRYQKHTHYFIRESCFWSYVYKAAGLPGRID
ncbi:hypothetical protein FE236_13025 [Mariprofundus erugo]|uniref:Uncharacterized protein n=1 Tax=Mariprofundus erugo TaxID=2528639 RepID=A0A5R9GMA3_9PROT|nr:hypothetical protein [Mariprofundus erugo]TLS67200.1 hypothetical protein FEF65_07085 [Mariprofundus erugo]TLS73578.1 hypothetical protein FE236_13025 [Mariprofundus erugo]